MEIKNTMKIIDEGKDIIMGSLDKIPIESFTEYKLKEWICKNDMIKELDKTWNLINKYKIDKHSNYISKTQVASFLSSLRNAITSNSAPKGAKTNSD